MLLQQRYFNINILSINVLQNNTLSDAAERRQRGNGGAR
jgi:hypothetical protein